MIPSVVFNLDLVDVNCSSQYEVMSFTQRMPSLGHKNKSIREIDKPLGVVKSVICYSLKKTESTVQLSNSKKT